MHKQCENCYYKQILSAARGEYCCHYLLETGQRRKVDQDGNCLSKREVTKRDKEKKEEKKETWGWNG